MWIAPPSIRLSFALELGCSEKDLQPDFDTWVSIAAVSSTLNGKHTQPASWLRAWKTAAWLQRLSGAAISEKSQSPHFAEWWTASSWVFRAKTYLLHRLNAEQDETVKAAIKEALHTLAEHH